MKCSICGQWMGQAIYTITRLNVFAKVAIMNVDVSCLRGMIGNGNVRKLDNALVKDGWSQQPLPDPPY